MWPGEGAPESAWAPCAAPPPTSGELERLFFAALERALPLHFSTRPLVSARRGGRTLITNAHVLVRGCAPGTSYCDLFGTWSDRAGYAGGPIVRTLDALVPFLKARSVGELRAARDYLSEAVVARREQLRPPSGSYGRHLHMVRVMGGTLHHLRQLVRWLALSDAPAWRRQRAGAASATLDHTALTRR
ncbi:hypothetical protein FJT64_007214 [Amphibalanus amphitrite]|uniref:Uncharacterized protein n=1 Tax=Amphibalanus amphitrite TaxID=1232801 RepID=A0A6A4VZ85_AMPAM|nr:hypothetical protein FJT64_007214 [Amphibalanus amphitrite]